MLNELCGTIRDGGKEGSAPVKELNSRLSTRRLGTPVSQRAGSVPRKLLFAACSSCSAASWRQLSGSVPADVRQLV